MAPPSLDDAPALERHHREGHCFTAGTMPELQGAIDQHLFAREVAHLRAVEARLAHLQEESDARTEADRRRIDALEQGSP